MHGSTIKVVFLAFMKVDDIAIDKSANKFLSVRLKIIKDVLQ
jgi:hypothetical protein